MRTVACLVANEQPLRQPKTLPSFRGFFLTATTTQHNNLFRAFAAQFEEQVMCYNTTREPRGHVSWRARPDCAPLA